MLINIPDSAVKWIKLHRTKFRDLSDEQVKQGYAESIKADLISMQPFLPERLKQIGAGILDIGCGLAGIDAALKTVYKRASLHLMDGTGEGANKVGYRPALDVYNDMDATRELLAANGVKTFKAHEPDPDAEIAPVDLILSLYSWGHHYPVSVYLDLAKRTLKPGGRIILDLRIGQGGKAEMEKHFKFVAVCQTHKSERCVFEKESE